MRNPVADLPGPVLRSVSRLLLPGLCSALVLGACCLAWVACPPVAADARETTRDTGPMTEHLRTALDLFRRRCANCHALDGTGSRLRSRLPQMPDFTSRPWQQRREDDELIVSILDGKGDHMPAFRGKVNEETAQDLVSLIRTFDPSYDPATARRSALGADEFNRRYRQLEMQLEDLKKRFRELSSDSGKR